MRRNSVYHIFVVFSNNFYQFCNTVWIFSYNSNPVTFWLNKVTVVSPSIRGVYIVLGESVDTALWSRRRPRTILTFTTPVSIHVNGSRVRWSWSEPVHTGFPLALVTVVRPLGGNRALESHRVSQLSWCWHRLLDHSLGDKSVVIVICIVKYHQKVLKMLVILLNLNIEKDWAYLWRTERCNCPRSQVRIVDRNN